MRLRDEFEEVTRQRRCPICDRADWCMVARNDPPSKAICARVERGAQRRIGEAGWLHVLRDDRASRGPFVRPICVEVAEPARRDFGKLADDCHQRVDPHRLAILAGQLGVSLQSLRRLRVGRLDKPSAWTFPMVNGAGMVCGIRLRCDNGNKLSVKGGREGLFIAQDLPADERLLICEGPTDTAALLDLQFAAIGRPSCTGGIKPIVELLRKRKPREVVIVADGDEPGQRGANNLASVVAAYVPTVRVITPPAGVKDARAWKCEGATRESIVEAIESALVRRLSIRVVQAKG